MRSCNAIHKIVGIVALASFFLWALALANPQPASASAQGWISGFTLAQNAPAAAPELPAAPGPGLGCVAAPLSTWLDSARLSQRNLNRMACSCSKHSRQASTGALGVRGFHPRPSSRTLPPEFAAAFGKPRVQNANCLLLHLLDSARRLALPRHSRQLSNSRAKSRLRQHQYFEHLRAGNERRRIVLLRGDVIA